MIALGSVLRARRKVLGLTQEKLAELADLHPTYISEIERGRVNASIYSISVVANVLKMESVELINLHTASGNRQLENELAEISEKIRRLDEARQKLVLSGLNGMLDNFG